MLAGDGGQYGGYLSEDLRIRVIEARGGVVTSWCGGTVRERASAIRWVDVWRRTGSTAPYPRGGDRRSGRIEGAAAFLLAKVEETPDITLAELQALLKEREVAGRCGGSSIAMGSVRTPPSRSALRRAPAGLARKPTRSRSPPTGATGGAAYGQGRDRFSNRAGTVAAPMLLDGPMNGVAFLAYVEAGLVRPRYRVIRSYGQLACSQGLRRQTGNRAGDTSAPAALFDLPIEQAFAKLKALIIAE